MDKRIIRKEMIKLRDLLGQAEIDRRSKLIQKYILSLESYQLASLIMSYVSFRSEVDTKNLIQTALHDKGRVVVPLCQPEGYELLPCEIESFEELISGTWGILEPSKPCKNIVKHCEIDIVIIPGLSFDRNFNRLGYGAGYYDRFLPQLRRSAVKIGIAYDFQLTDSLPVGSHDITMDCIITESGILLRE